MILPEQKIVQEGQWASNLQTPEDGIYRNKAKIYVGFLSLNEATARKIYEFTQR